MSAFGPGVEQARPPTGTIVAGHLADLGELTPAERAVYDEVAAEGTLPADYGHVSVRACLACARGVALSERSMLAVQLGALVVCMGCARAIREEQLRRGAAAPPLQHLGGLAVGRRALP